MKFNLSTGDLLLHLLTHISLGLSFRALKICTRNSNFFPSEPACTVMPVRQLHYFAGKANSTVAAIAILGDQNNNTVLHKNVKKLQN